MKYLFKHKESFLKSLRSAGHVILLSDYDGTLTPIVNRPVDAVLSTEVRQVLHSLADKSGISVGIISGRSMAEVKIMVGLDGIFYAGNHGLEIEGPGISFIHPEAEKAQNMMDNLAGQLHAALNGIDGIIIENKRFSLSVHYRLVADDELSSATGIFEKVTDQWQSNDRVRITSGKKVWEIRPPIKWDKGKAVELLEQKIKSHYKLGRCSVLYLGDDTTDEDAFKVVRKMNGWSIFVSGESNSSNAGYFLKSPSEVLILLKQLLDIEIDI